MATIPNEITMKVNVDTSELDKLIGGHTLDVVTKGEFILRNLDDVSPGELFERLSEGYGFLLYDRKNNLYASVNQLKQILSTGEF